MRMTAAQKILNKLERSNRRCRPLELVPGEKNAAFLEVFASTISSQELKDSLGIKRQTLSVAIDQLHTAKKILVYRFYGQDQTYISNNDYQERQGEFARHPDIRVALPAEPEEEFVGERLLELAFGKLVASDETKKHISIGVSEKTAEGGAFRIHFNTGFQLMNLCVRRSIFDISGGNPVTVFLSYTAPLHLRDYDVGISQQQIKLFSSGSMCLCLPQPSLGVASPFIFWPDNDDEKSLDLAKFGLYTITLYPDGNSFAVTQIAGPWCPQAVNLNNKDVEAFLDVDRWTMSDEIWPISSERLPYSPPPAVEAMPEYKLPDELAPPMFSLAPWAELSRLRHEGVGINVDVVDLDDFTTLFREYLSKRTWRMKMPALLTLRQTSLLITA